MPTRMVSRSAVSRIGSWPSDTDVPPTTDPENGNAGTGWLAGGEMGRWAIKAYNREVEEHNAKLKSDSP